MKKNIGPMMMIFIRFMLLAAMMPLLALILSCDRAYLSNDATGSMSVSVSLEDARITTPDLSQDDFSFIINGNGPGDNTFRVETVQGADSAHVDNLPFGTWNITVEALFHGESGAVSFGDGTATTEVHPASSSLCSVSIVPFEGQGVFDITVNWDSTSVENPVLEGSLSREGFDPVGIVFSMGSGQATATMTLDSGIYALDIVLKDGAVYEFGGIANSIRITNSLTTIAEYTITGSAAPDTEDPSIPGGLRMTEVQSYRVSLAWNASSDNTAVTGYRVYRGGAAIGTSASTTYSDTTVVPESTYAYTVAAYDAEGNESEQSASVSVTTPVASTSQIIADHTVVDRYDDIPVYYINEVKKMMVAFPGESHSEAYRSGMEFLEAQNSTYACNVATGEAPTNQYLRVNNSSAGEATWYTWYAYDNHAGSNNMVIKNLIAEYNSHGHPMHAIGFGWCWDTTWTNGPTATKDSVYGCGWAGSSDGGPDGNLPWGLDAGDYAITGNRVSMDTYLEATEDYRLYCIAQGYPTKVIFTTSPADGYTGENGYQRYLKHERIRNYVKANSNRILFDYSDILCYDDNGTPNTTSWNGHTFPQITSTNAGDGSVGHIGAVGALRLAKAQWWMLARIAGWDGN